MLHSNCTQDISGDNSLTLNHVRITGMTGTAQTATVDGAAASVNYNNVTNVTTVDGFTHNITQHLDMVLTFT